MMMMAEESIPVLLLFLPFHPPLSPVMHTEVHNDSQSLTRGLQESESGFSSRVRDVKRLRDEEDMEGPLLPVREWETDQTEGFEGQGMPSAAEFQTRHTLSEEEIHDHGTIPPEMEFPGFRGDLGCSSTIAVRELDQRLVRDPVQVLVQEVQESVQEFLCILLQIPFELFLLRGEDVLECLRSEDFRIQPRDTGRRLGSPETLDQFPEMESDPSIRRGEWIPKIPFPEMEIRQEIQDEGLRRCETLHGAIHVTGVSEIPESAQTQGRILRTPEGQDVIPSILLSFIILSFIILSFFLRWSSAPATPVKKPRPESIFTGILLRRGIL